MEGAQEPTGESGIGVRGSSSKTRAGVISPGGKHHPSFPHSLEHSSGQTLRARQLYRREIHH